MVLETCAGKNLGKLKFNSLIFEWAFIYFMEH